MSAQVLEVIDAAIRRIETQGVIPHADGLREARATVAALIAEHDALREACKEALDAGNDGDWQSARNALTRALTTGESA